MLHHTALEVAPDAIEAESRFWILAGFESVPVPGSLGDEFTWFERRGTQVHLMHTEVPTVPPRGHTAVVVADFQAAFDRLASEGYEITEGSPHWGERRAKVITPAGHRVEIMAAPPLPVVE